MREGIGKKRTPIAKLQLFSFPFLDIFHRGV